ncbi:hypothetical protein QQG55_56990 [Brugia pahangi]
MRRESFKMIKSSSPIMSSSLSRVQSSAAISSRAQKQTLRNDESDDAMEPMENLSSVDANINQQLKTRTDRYKSFGTHYQEAIRGPHASFRLRMLQEQHIQPSFIPKKVNHTRAKELEYKYLNKSEFGTFAKQNGNETFDGKFDIIC